MPLLSIITTLLCTMKLKSGRPDRRNVLHNHMLSPIPQVTRIVLLWVNNHFNDFEGDPAMTRFLEEFEKNLEDTVRMFCFVLFYNSGVSLLPQQE